MSWLPPAVGGRETDAMSTLPPPRPPRAGGASDGSTLPPPANANNADVAFDWDLVRRYADRWFRPLLEPQSWVDRKSTRLNSSHSTLSRMPSSA